MSSIPSPCVVCGRTSKGTRCPKHAAQHEAGIRATQGWRQGYSSPSYRRNRAAARARARCQECNMTEADLKTAGRRDRLQVHHERPLSQGGTNDPTNLALLCGRCHGRRHGASRAL